MPIDSDIDRIIDEIQILQKCSVEHTGRITSLETQPTNEELEATIKKQNQTLLHIQAELKFIKQHPFDMVLVSGSIENMSRVIEGQTERNKLASTIKDLNLELTKKRAIIDEKDKMLEKQVHEISGMWGKVNALEAELSARKEDSAVLMKVVEIVRDNGIYPYGAINELADLLVDYLDAPEGPPETPIDEKVCVFCGCENPSVQVGSDWFCGMRCVHGQADVNKHLHNTDEPQEITVTFLELP